MRQKFIITILLLFFVSSMPSAFAHESNRLRPSFFEGKLSVYPAPLVGQRATIGLELTAIADDCEGATIQFRTPSGIALLGRSVFEDQYLTRGLSYQYSTDIEVLEEGSYALQATVYFQLSDNQRRVEHFFIYLLVGETDSQAGDELLFPLTKQKLQPKKLAPAAFADRRSGGTITVSGHITYYDDNLSIEIPIQKVKVELLEENQRGSYHIDNTFTDDDGFYLFEDVSNSDIEDGTGRDIKLRIVFENDVLKLTDANITVYSLESPTMYNVSDGQIDSDYFIDNRNQLRSLGYIFNCVMYTHNFLQENLGWQRNKIEVRWPSGDWSKYRYEYYKYVGMIFKEYIQLPAGKEWDRTTIFHEYGHSVMTALYGYNIHNLPQDSFEGGHSVYTISDLGFAMKEGWAEFFEALVEDNAYNVVAYSNADEPNIESNDWWTGGIDGDGSNTQGEIVEGAVASILWDITDTGNSHDSTPGEDDDNMGDMLEEIWDLMQKDKPSNILEFWDHWTENGYGQTRSLYSIYADHNIEVVPPWDVNKDGIVDSLDLTVIGSYFGQEVSGFAQPNPDVNRDGKVNILDLIICASNIGF